MKAMILAAGRGERLKPLTNTIPKPLLKAGSRSLIEYHLVNLRNAGVSDVVINIAWLGELIKKKLGDGQNYNLNISYSDEGDCALETAGGIIKALPMLGNEPFLVVNGDIWSDYDFRLLVDKKLQGEAHLVLVENPDHNKEGDFALEKNLLKNSGDTMYTYSGIGLYSKQFFEGLSLEKSALAPIIRKKADRLLVAGSIHDGLWTDVGSIDRLEALNKNLPG
jgi:MurNAc alpha-1-phosphate uridylyltransferase